MRADEIIELLPEIYQRCAVDGGPLRAIVDAMESLHAPVERVLDDLDARIDPLRTTPPFRAMLGHWVNLECVMSPTDATATTVRPLVDDDHLGALVSAAWYLARWRGTARGLEAALHLATGDRDIRVFDQPPEASPERETPWPPFHFEVRVPAATQALGDVIARIVRIEKPAHATHEITFEATPEDAAGSTPGVSPEAPSTTEPAREPSP